MRCAEPRSEPRFEPRRHKRRQRGAAVIVALLAVALAAGLAAAILGDFGRSLDSVAGRQDQAQARLLARGAVDWARNVLADDRQRTGVDHAGELWAVRVPPTPVGEGSVGGEIRDRSGLFNLNALAPDGRVDPDAAGQLGRLLAVAGAPEADGRSLAEAIAAWVGPPAAASPGADRDAPRNGSLLDASELRLIAGFDEALVARLAPFVTALPAPTRINVNTAPAEVLVAMLPGLDLAAARVLVAERERAWFRDLADFSSRATPHLAGRAPTTAALDVKSRHFAVTGHARYGEATVQLEVLLDRRETWPAILWQRIP